ncbi:MAG: SRPBCC family protein [Deltaproteobacteria bacterium]|nr:SRPBCC family protein [Deltaproteobacteria bacterium]MDQ3298030.1 SRPBCC family protein [Myxococcota bacterium]
MSQATKTDTDRIEKRIELRAPVARVWKALSNAREFGTWFGADLRDDFVPGVTARGHMKIPGYEHLTIELMIERMEKETLLAFRWHPFAIDPDVDYSQEPTTLVELRLTPSPTGTLLVVTETGFDALPAARRAKAFEMNSGGWAAQLENIARYVHADVA